VERSEDSQAAGSPVLAAVSHAMVALHKEQFGRGATKVRTYFAGPDILVTLMEEGLLPAERVMVGLGEQQRVRENRLFFQVVTRERFVAEIERITGRSVRSFLSATDPDRDVVIEVAVLEPRESRGDDGGGGALTTERAGEPGQDR
jgi:uncharacterized protein YbcI